MLSQLLAALIWYEGGRYASPWPNKGTIKNKWYHGTIAISTLSIWSVRNGGIKITTWELKSLGVDIRFFQETKLTRNIYTRNISGYNIVVIQLMSTCRGGVKFSMEGQQALWDVGDTNTGAECYHCWVGDRLGLVFCHGTLHPIHWSNSGGGGQKDMTIIPNTLHALSIWWFEHQLGMHMGWKGWENCRIHGCNAIGEYELLFHTIGGNWHWDDEADNRDVMVGMSC